MWDSNIRLELIANDIVQAVDSFSVRNDSKAFENAIVNLKKEFPSLSEQEIWQIIGICVSVYGKKEAEKAELAIPWIFIHRHKHMTALSPSYK